MHTLELQKILINKGNYVPVFNEEAQQKIIKEMEVYLRAFLMLAQGGVSGEFVAPFA